MNADPSIYEVYPFFMKSKRLWQWEVRDGKAACTCNNSAELLKLDSVHREALWDLLACAIFLQGFGLYSGTESAVKCRGVVSM